MNYAVVFGCAWFTTLPIAVVAVARAWTICCRVASTGVMVASANWLRWLYRDGRVYENPAAVIGRMDALARRLV